MSQCGVMFPFNRSTLLSDVIRETSWLEIVCRQRDCAERLSVSKLVHEHEVEATPRAV